MPTSAWHYITPIMQELATLHAKEPIQSVLDVGCGAGKWGFLVRDNLDFYHRAKYYRREWATGIDGIEAFPDYRNPIHDYIYNTVHWGDARDIIHRLPDYDVILAMEVIEHLDKAEGLALLATLAAKSRRCVVLSFPPEVDDGGHHVLEQQEVHGNIYETHRSVWKEEDLAPYSPRTIAHQTFLLTGSSHATQRAAAPPLEPAPPFVPLRYQLVDKLNGAFKRALPSLHSSARKAYSSRSKP